MILRDIELKRYPCCRASGYILERRQNGECYRVAQFIRDSGRERELVYGRGLNEACGALADSHTDEDQGSGALHKVGGER